jgi:formiminotetrahydrofolate cyclodeaminase
MYKDKSIEQFTEELASETAVPGGGGAGALVAAIGISLGNMVGNLTVGKNLQKDTETELRDLIKRGEDLRIRFLDAIDEDAEAFEPLSKAYGIPRGEDGREEKIENCLKTAAQAPLRVFDLCCEAIDIMSEFAKRGNRMVISDAAAGMTFCRAAMDTAAVNVRINTRLMKDRKTAEDMNAHISYAIVIYEEKAENVYEKIYEELG